MPRTAGLFVFLLLGFLLLSQISLGAAQPNVIIVMTDDQGYGELSWHGNPILQTPHLDRLASQSVRLTDFHVAPMCTPTRGQLMTGLDAFRNGAMNVSSGRTLLRPELTTMADLFRAAGYRTGIFGKWHLGDNYPFRPEDRGFEEALWFPSSHISSVPDHWNNDYFDDTYIHNGRREAYQGYCTDVFFREAQRWVGESPEEPFFAYVPLNAAHSPHFVPDEEREPIRQAMAENPEVVEHLSPARRQALVSFLAMCRNIDRNVGRLNRFLDETGLAENTILIFLTDNGSTMGPNYFNAGMRGRKVTLWEGGHRVPCFVRWPGGDLGEPRDVDALTHVQDLLPTLAELAGISKVPKNLDGQSLAPLLRGEDESLGDRMLVVNYSRMPFRPDRYRPDSAAVPRRDGAAVLWEHWRLLENERLYDLRNDPHQDHDISAEHPEVVAKMRDHLNRWWAEVKDDAGEVQRVVIGNEAENPMLLSACEWLDVFVDQQKQVRRGVEKLGTWHLVVDQPGTYRFQLRRWPREANRPLAAGVPEIEVTDGRYPPGRRLPIAAGEIEIGRHRDRAAADPGATHLTFTAELTAGPTELTTRFLDADGEVICGAYYVYVERVSE